VAALGAGPGRRPHRARGVVFGQADPRQAVVADLGDNAADLFEKTGFVARLRQGFVTLAESHQHAVGAAQRVGRALALNGLGENVGDRVDEMDVVFAEAAPARGVRAEHAEDPFVVLDDDAHAADDAVLAPQRRAAEAGIRLQVVDAHRGRADEIFLPAHAGAQQQPFAAGQKLEYFGVLDEQNAGHHRSGFLEQLIEGYRTEGALAELGDRRLLAIAHLQPRL